VHDDARVAFECCFIVSLFTGTQYVLFFEHVRMSASKVEREVGGWRLESSFLFLESGRARARYSRTRTPAMYIPT